MATIGKNSPTAPAATIRSLNALPSISFSRRIGSRIPRAVVVSASDTGTNAWTNPLAASTPTTPRARIRLTSHPRIASRPGAARNMAKSSSYPASRNRNPSPRLTKGATLPVCAHPRTWGPMMTPPTRKTTT